MKKIHDRGHYEVEYHPRLAILRISILILVVVLVWVIASNIMDKDDEVEILDEEVILKEIYSDSQPIEDNSRGVFYSLDENVYAEGQNELIEKTEGVYVRFLRFKITNNPNLKLVLSTDIYGSSRIDVVSKLLGNVGTQEYKLPEGINLEVHNHLLFWDKEKNEPLAYTVLNQY